MIGIAPLPIDPIQEIVGALCAIDPEYCRLSLLDYRGEVPNPVHIDKFLERPLAYEFYYQFRRRMEGWPPAVALRFQAEVDKRYQHILGGDFAPDFLLHRPDQVDANVAAIEFKRSAAGEREALADQVKLRRFLAPPLEYRYTVQVLVGWEPELSHVTALLVAGRQDADREILFSLKLQTRDLARV